jgi:hypothetical protein
MLELWFVMTDGRTRNRKARLIRAAQHAAKSARIARKHDFIDDAVELEIVSCEFLAAAC